MFGNQLISKNAASFNPHSNTTFDSNSLADAVGPIKFITKLWQNYSAVTDVNEQGILIGRLAFQRSVQQAFQAVMVHFAPLGKTCSDFVDRQTSPEQGVTFDNFSIGSAAAHPFFVRSREVLDKFLRAIDMEDSARVRVVSEVSQRFGRNFALILGHRENKDRFHEFREMLSLPSDARSLLAQHAEYQRWLFEEQRVLNYEPFALQHTYIETDCGELSYKQYQELLKKTGTPDEKRDPFSEESAPRQQAVSRIMQLIQDSKFKECIVIQGHAGAGKSSLTKRLCCELLTHGFRPIRIELKDLDVTSTDLHISQLLPMAVKLGDEAYDSDLVDRFLPRDSSLDDAIKGDLRTVNSQRISNYVLILDAWDEVSIGASEGYQQAIDKLLHRLREQYLSQRLGYHVRVILSGRPSDAVMQSGFLKDDSVILTMRPFVPDQLKTFVEGLKLALERQPVRLPANWKQEGIWARWSLDDTSKTDLVEKRFREAFEKRAKKEPTRDEALEILGLPLLCQLALRLIAEWEGDAQSVLDNTTVLYRSLVDMLGMGAKPKDQSLVAQAPHLGGDDLRNLLRSTAEAMSVRGVESISRAELEVRIGEDCDDLEQRVEKLSRDQVLSRLMVSFFFKGGHKDLGCEFSHKSFREYLFAEQIVEELRKFGERTEAFSEKAAKDYWRDFEERDPRFLLSRRMAELLGPNWLTTEVGQHLTRLIGWEIARSGGREPYAIPEKLRAVQSHPLTMAQWERVRDGLADLWDWWGEGVHMRPCPTKAKGGRLDWGCVAWDVARDCRDLSNDKATSIVPVRMTTIDGHLGDGLFQLCMDLHREVILGQRGIDDVDQIKVVKLAEETDSQRRYQSKAHIDGYDAVLFRPSGSSGDFFRTYSQRIEAAGFRGARRGLFPRGISLSLTDLRTFSGYRAFLGARDIRKSVLAHGQYQFSYLYFVNLSGSDLSGSELSGATLAEAIFRAADLRGARLTEANLRGAVLVGAILTDANLTRADLTKANLSGADLRGANLTEAIVTLEQIQSALTDQNTKGLDSIRHRKKKK